MYFDPAERKSEGQEEGAIHIRYCGQALGLLLWPVSRHVSDLSSSSESASHAKVLADRQRG